MVKITEIVSLNTTNKWWMCYVENNLFCYTVFNKDLSLRKTINFVEDNGNFVTKINGIQTYVSLGYQQNCQESANFVIFSGYIALSDNCKEIDTFNNSPALQYFHNCRVKLDRVSNISIAMLEPFSLGILEMLNLYLAKDPVFTILDEHIWTKEFLSINYSKIMLEIYEKTHTLNTTNREVFLSKIFYL